MKGLYWRPTKVSKKLLLIVAVVAVSGLASVERFRHVEIQPDELEKRAAADLAHRCLLQVKHEKEIRGYGVLPQYDPAASGLIGLPLSSVTSVPGHLGAKQTSINPNFAAAVVGMLTDAGVKAGDCVAVGCSGSFPAINVAVYSALETLDLQPVIVCSAGASQYGANMPDLLWVDMERALHDAELISFRAIAASIGGYEDQGLGMSDEARRLVMNGISRNGLSLIRESTLAESIARRMEHFEQAADGRRIGAYINVGGGAASVGRAVGKKLYEPGLNIAPTAEAMKIDSVMSRFARRGTPVIHLVEITQLAAAYGLPVAPIVTPQPGVGPLFASVSYNRLLAAAVLIAIIAAVWFLVVRPAGTRWRSRTNQAHDPPPVLHLAGEPNVELMV